MLRKQIRKRNLFVSVVKPNPFAGVPEPLLALLNASALIHGGLYLSC